MVAALVAAARPAPNAAASGQADTPGTAVEQTVRAFYDAFNTHTFDRVAEFTTDDWNHLNDPFGNRLELLESRRGGAFDAGRELSASGQTAWRMA